MTLAFLPQCLLQNYANETQTGLFTVQQIATLKGLGCDFDSSAYQALEMIAKLDSTAIPLETEDDFTAWLSNAKVLISKGMRPSLLKIPVYVVSL